MAAGNDTCQLDLLMVDERLDADAKDAADCSARGPQHWRDQYLPRRQGWWVVQKCYFRHFFMKK
jgi:hypothetical protein